MKLVHVIPHMNEEAAGPTQSVVRLCEALAAGGQSVAMHTMAAGRPLVGVDVVVHRQWKMLGQFGFSLELVKSLYDATAKADILHNHSLWSFPNMAAGLVTKGDRALLVTSPRGTLAPAARARSRLKKLLFSPLQQPAIDRAVCLHATSVMEYEDIRALGLKHPVAIIPNGIDIPQLENKPSKSDSSQYRRMIFLGRLHPIKGIEMLLRAWCELQNTNPDWELVIAGKGERTYVDSLKTLAGQLQLQRVTFPGPVYGLAKSYLYFSSELFILPTETENFGMAIAEAQAHGLPVVTTRGAPWAGLEQKQSGWWIERSQENIVKTLAVALRCDRGALELMGARGRAWMIADFDWLAVSQQMTSVYKWLHSGGTNPSCVLTN